MTNYNWLKAITLIAFTHQALAFNCQPIVNGHGKNSKDVLYELEPLKGERSANKETLTPPTVSEAVVRITLCGDDVLSKDDEFPDEDQVSIFLVVVNIYESPHLRSNLIPST